MGAKPEVKLYNYTPGQQKSLPWLICAGGPPIGGAISKSIALRMIDCLNNCRDINPVAVPKLLAACEQAIGFCVNARETWPDWKDHLDVGILYSKVSTALALARQEPQDGQGTHEGVPQTQNGREIDPGAAE